MPLHIMLHFWSVTCRCLGTKYQIVSSASCMKLFKDFTAVKVAPTTELLLLVGFEFRQHYSIIRLSRMYNVHHSAYSN